MGVTAPPMPDRNPETLLQKFHDKAVILSRDHAKEAQFYNRQEQCLTLPLAILNGVCSSGLIVSLATDNYAIFVVSCVLQLLATVLSAIVATLKPSQLKEQHTKAQLLAESVAEEIDMQLALPEPQRMNAMIFIERVRQILNALRDAAPGVQSGSAASPITPLPVPPPETILPVPAVEAPPTMEFFPVGGSATAATSTATLHKFQLHRLDGLLGRTGGGNNGGGGGSDSNGGSRGTSPGNNSGTLFGQ